VTMTPERFHELLDQGTADAPPAPHPRTDLAAGRSRLQRRRAAATGAGTAAAVIAIALGSALTGSPRSALESPGFATEPPSTAAPGSGDRQILEDVVDAAFPTPGRAALRNIRVNTFLRSWGVTRCGGTGAPLDSTADRYAQDTVPSLELIREKGFTEPSQESFKGARDDCQIGDELEAAAPAFEDWFALGEPWHELVRTTLEDPGLSALKAPMAQCLREATGAQVSDRDPVDSFLGGMDEGTEEDRRQGATAYADCGADYFGELERLLLAKRPAFVDEHRELLEDFARQLTALGYRP